MKLKRYREWRKVLEIETRELTVSGVLSVTTHMLAAALKLGVSKKMWCSRMRTCMRCPIYDNYHKRCKPHNDSELGCGCYAPLVAMVRKPCWGKTNFPEDDLGWE